MQFSTVLAISMFIISLIFLPYLNFSNVSTKILLLIYFNAWLSTISFLFVSKALRHMEISTVSPFLSFGPVFILIFSLLFLKEHVTNTQLFGMSLVIFGTYVLQSKKHDYFAPIKQIIKSKYIHFVFIALILNGISTTLDRYFLKNTSLDPVSYLFLLGTFLMINYTILLTILYNGFKEVNKGFKASGIIVLIIAVLIILSRLSLFESFSLTSAFLAEPIKRTSVLFVVLFGGALFHEKYLFKKFIASLFMLAGVYLITI
jgi:drug/metabolite transporter (DMT)-like permease